ncbi:OmpL47-type beta-barrel domain-containing protein [Paenibacillus qinlingensis]|uniref:OmpL47-type beta-barrel domain-containing protein n=1 Tax=Paenibacillus qinlingensis TaxID=1837343 RepID=UPI001566FE1D|nr:right-handed parallel beta-helix repeat-containing protein [Paenibacillus qinlingensis]NQX58045.1 right-handed parallel beta-helix repeat-containing protein [Paenibacillus qinlingensis]
MRKKMKLGYGLALTLTLGFVGGLLPAPSAFASATTYYVAPNGNDAAAGNVEASPFKTINKCAQIMTPGDTCIIASGTYRETVTPVASGQSGQPITFKTAPGATVIVSGTEPISGWTQHTGQIYKADLSWSLGKENQLFVNNGLVVAPLWEARWPNISEYSLPGLKAGVATADSGSATSIVDSDLSQPSDFWKNALVWERGGNAYQGMTSKVTGYNSATHTLTYEPITGDYQELYPRLGSTYFLSGVLGALDAPNEWYVDETAQQVYLWAPDGGVPSNVEVKKRKTAFNLNGKSFIQMKGIRTFAANITMNGSSNNVLDGIQADYLYFSNYSQNTTNADQLNGGISIFGNNNEIKNSKIGYSSGTLINIEGNSNRIVNNIIHNGSYMASYDPLVKLSSGTSNLISYNEIRESGRFNIYWRSGSGEISYNDISNGMWLSRDGALLYSWGLDMGNSDIHHNLIHDSKGSDMSVGLYFDNYANNVVAHHNVIYNNDVGIQMNTPGNYRLIYNNTVVNHRTGSIGYWGSPPYNQELFGSRVYNNIFTNSVSLTADTANGYNTTSSTGVNFMNPAANDFRLNDGSTAINTGAVIKGVTDSYVGIAPDAGAYEFGGANWKAGPDFANPPSVTYTQIDTPYMNLIKNSGFNGTTDNWLKWTTNGTTDVQSVPASPDWQVRGRQYRLKLGPGGAGVEQKITGLKPDTEYKFVAWVYNEPGESIVLGVFNYGGNAIDTTVKDNQYVRKEITFRTGTTNTDARVRIYKPGSAVGLSYADDTGLIENTPFDAGVSQTFLKEVQFTTPVNLFTVGEQGILNLTGTQQNGSPADLSTADIQLVSSDPQVLRINSVSNGSASVTALAAGQVTVSATVFKDGITKATSQISTVFPNGGTDTGPAGWALKTYGSNSKGFVTTNPEGTYSVVGVGDNVWDKTDDFVYLSKNVHTSDPNAKVTFTATIDSFDFADPASVGLMFRAKDTADSKHVQFRTDGTGKVLRYVFRNSESILDSQNPPAQQKYWGSSTGLLLDYAGKSINTPFQMKLVKEGNKVTGYYYKESQWLSIGSTTVEFEGTDFLAGIGMFSGSGKPPVKAVISQLDIQVEDVLASVSMTADNMFVGAGSPASLTVTGYVSDGSLADLGQATISYRSDNNAVATVDSNGKVTATGEGITSVHASVTLGAVTKETSVGLLTDLRAPNTVAEAVYGTQTTVVALSATDNLSGVARTEYRLGDNGAWNPYSGLIIIPQGSANLIQYRSVDKAGNAEAIKAIVIGSQDITAPSLSVTLDKTVIWPPNKKMIAIKATVNASDADSGLASVILTSITCSDPTSSPSDIQAAIGTSATSFSLRAEKVRSYTITYTATDNAGNKTVVTSVVTVPHDMAGN